ncbi:hypothetical protein ENUP19_0161G0044 [Entamoeba nuttalli]|uniref:F-box domain containing protein n=1 Tax=Entamoeba nuttalli TaxID=412467 RepID=A0ABQ0DLP2_9EUKA
MKKLERVYLMNIIFYLGTVDDLINFLQISKNCYESFQMMHTNPNYSFKTQKKELQIFKDCSSLETVTGSFEYIKDFQCNLNAILILPVQHGASQGEMNTVIEELVSCANRIVKLKLVTSRSDFEIHWKTFINLKDITFDLSGESWVHFYDGYLTLNQIFFDKWRFHELKDLSKLKRVCVRSISFSCKPPNVESLLASKWFVEVANWNRKLYVYGNQIQKSSPNENIVLITNSLTREPKTLVSYLSFCQIDGSHLDLFIRDWKKYYPAKVMLHSCKTVTDISMVDSLEEVEIGTSGNGYTFILPKNIKKVKVGNGVNTIDISLCHDIQFEVQYLNFWVEPSKKEITSLVVDCTYLHEDSLTRITEFENVKQIILNEYDDKIILPPLPESVTVIKNYLTTKQQPYVFYTHINKKGPRELDEEDSSHQRGCVIN